MGAIIRWSAPIPRSAPNRAVTTVRTRKMFSSSVVATMLALNTEPMPLRNSPV
jgi:hypothetical protein